MSSLSFPSIVPTILFPRKWMIESVAVIAILLVAIFSRWYLLDTRPGWEIDEAVYFRVTDNITHYGIPVFKPEPGRPVVPYLSHPPFYFNLLSEWYTLLGEHDIYAGRLLASVGSLTALILLYFFLREAVGRWASFICLLLITTDGWVIFTNRIGWMENTQLIFVVLAMWMYFRAQRDGKLLHFILAGTYVSIVVLYKHIGAYILVSILVNWLLQRRFHKEHIILMCVVGLLIGMYISIMYYQWGGEFLAQYFNQFNRTLGIKQSRGLNYGLDKVIAAVVSRYWIFFTTIACFIIASILSFVKLVQILRGKDQPHIVFLSWSLGALISGIALGLKSPHYFILWIVPFYCLIAVNIATIKVNMRLIVTFVLILQVNAMTWNWRFIQHNDNLLMQTQAFASRYVPHDATIVSEEAICAVIPQPCARFENYQTVDKIQANDIKYVFLYYSTTQFPPDSLLPLVTSTTKLGEVAGFKDYIEFRER